MAGILFRILTLPLYLLFGFNSNQVAGMPTLLLIDYKFDEAAQEGSSVVMELVARRTGLVAWIMSKLGILSRYYLRVTNQEVQIAYGSMSGTQHFVAPLSLITTSNVALEKPAFLVYVGLVIIFGSIAALLQGVSGAVIGIIVGLLCLGWYYWSKRLIVAFSTSDLDDRYGLSFRTSRITGKNVSFEELQKALDHVNNVILNAHHSLSN